MSLIGKSIGHVGCAPQPPPRCPQRSFLLHFPSPYIYRPRESRKPRLHNHSNYATSAVSLFHSLSPSLSLICFPPSPKCMCFPWLLLMLPGCSCCSCHGDCIPLPLVIMAHTDTHTLPSVTFLSNDSAAVQTRDSPHGDITVIKQEHKPMHDYIMENSPFLFPDISKVKLH